MRWIPTLTLTLVLITPLQAQAAPSAQPEPWYRITFSAFAREAWSCQRDLPGHGLPERLARADMEHQRYRLDDVTEHGQVVETTLVGSEALRFPDVRPLEGSLTWYRGKPRCEQALARLRGAAQQERQRQGR
jgi:hypothetical protein